MTPRSAFALALLGLTGCLKARPPATPTVALAPDERAERAALAPKVATLSHEAEALLRAQDELVWRSWTEGVPVDIGDTYRGKEALFSPESVHEVERMRALSQAPREVRALTHLENYVAGEYLARSINELTDAIANLEASLSFNLDGRDYAYRDLERLLANERSSVKRRALYEGATPAVERLSQSLTRKNQRLEELVLSLGYPSYEAFGAQLRQVDLERLGLVADALLTRTDGTYRAVLERLAREELQLPPERLSRADLPRLFRPTGVDAFFPKAELVPRAQATLQGMGIDLGRLKNIHLDLKDAPRKNPRGLTLALQVPSDVRVSLKLQGGVRDQRALFHELGHALHDGLTTERTFELAKLGDRTAAEAFSFLFEDLVEDPLWLEQVAGLSGEKARTFLADASAHQLFLVRRAAGRLLYELGVHHGADVDVPALYKALMERTLGIRLGPADLARAVVDQEDFYPSADFLRARFLADQLQAQLKARFGAAWWRQRAAGDFLKGLFAPGNSRSADALAQSMGEPTVSPDALLARLGARLGAAPAAAETPAPAGTSGR